MQNLELKTLCFGMILIIAPHMDDEALACGGLIAKLPYKDRIHILYATDGMKSPAPVLTGRDQASPSLGKIRMQESTEAMKVLGIPGQNLHFLSLSDGGLQKNVLALQDSVQKIIETLEPQFIFVPFRYDRHPDHLAVNRVVISTLQKGGRESQLVEYFIYHRWRLLPKHDIRKYIKPQFLFQLDISNVREQKRQALDCFVSQTTNYYPWQTRPILTSTLLDEECQNPEHFLIAPVSFGGMAVFSGSLLWIRLVHRLEPFLQRWKYRLSSLAKRIFENRVSKSY